MRAISIPSGTLGVPIQLWGLLWDLSWHREFGRDSLLDPPHIVMGIGILVGIFALWRERRQIYLPRPHPLGGAMLLLTGIVWEIAALSLDALWHILFGPDLEMGIWSPPHIMVITGVWVQAIWYVVSVLSQKAHQKPVTPVYALLGCAALIAIVSPFFGPIEYLPRRRDPFVYPLVMTVLSAFVLLAGRTATQHPWACTITAVLFTLIRGLPSLILWLSGRAVPGYPTPLLVPALLIDWSLYRSGTATRRLGFLSGAAFGLLPLLELPLVNWGASYQWPLEVALVAILPVAVTGMFISSLGWRAGSRLRRVLLLPGPSQTLNNAP